ncbi:hypothetical protein E4U53_005605 [Claviceps sorghi]|nr:hypothetical protein E4U53_005605 [Claviceps sorghi]
MALDVASCFRAWYLFLYRLPGGEDGEDGEIDEIDEIDGLGHQVVMRAMVRDVRSSGFRHSFIQLHRRMNKRVAAWKKKASSKVHDGRSCRAEKAGAWRLWIIRTTGSHRSHPGRQVRPAAGQAAGQAQLDGHVYFLDDAARHQRQPLRRSLYPNPSPLAPHYQPSPPSPSSLPSLCAALSNASATMNLVAMNHNFDMTAAAPKIASASAPAPATATSSHASTSPSASVSVTSPMSIDAACNANSVPNAPAIKRRSPIACRSIFPARGQPDLDREYRHPRTRSDKSSRGSVTGAAVKSRRSVTGSLPASPRRYADDWDSLPPAKDLIDGVRLFSQQYFQLGFIPKEQYQERLQKDLRSTSLFLLMSILSISARLSHALKLRYGNGVKAAEYFMARASSIASEEVYQEPTLERCQAFFLLSIAQQSSGERNRSHINMGIAIRMAVLMQLHCEETYRISNPTPELVIRAESARRTLWMLYSQDNLHSGPMSPVSLAANDITALLPGDEEHFAHGLEPRSRAALDGTPPALDNPKLIRDPGRSLFATLMQVHGWWGLVGRRAVRCSKSARPWDSASEFSQTARNLREWEQDLPHEHVWSVFLLKRHKAERQELAYLCVTMMTRLSNIVLRRPYLNE